MSAPLSGAATGPLAGVRVLDLSVHVLGPVATAVLGDMGADVIKVEPPGGDPMREVGPARSPGMGSFFLVANRNKRSVVLDLKHPPAHAALMRLVEGADVLVHNMRPNAAERLGIGYRAIAEHNPAIVYAWSTGYRKDGPRRDRPAYDDVIQGESGVAGLVLAATGEARYAPMPVADKLVGYVLASAVAMALVHRARTGEGQEVHVPMLETMLGFNLVEHLWHGALDEAGKGVGYPRMLTPHRRPYPTQDGYLCLLAHTDAQWQRLLAAVDRPEAAGDPRFARLAARSQNIDALLAILVEALAERTTAQWQERLDAADIPNAPMATLDDLLEDEYLRETGFFRRFEHPTDGPMMTPGIAIEMSRSPGSLHRAPPRLGADTEAVLAEAGYAADEIAAIAGASRSPG